MPYHVADDAYPADTGDDYDAVEDDSYPADDDYPSDSGYGGYGTYDDEYPKPEMP